MRMAIALFAPLTALAGASAVYRADGVFADPTHPMWRDIAATDISLNEQMIQPPIGGGGIKAAHLQAAHDGE